MKYLFTVLATLVILVTVGIIFWVLERTPIRDKYLSPVKYGELSKKNWLYLLALLVGINYHSFDFILQLSISFHKYVNEFLTKFGWLIGRWNLHWTHVAVEIVVVFLVADLVTYLNHRFILHGPLWKYHAVHHHEDSLGWNSAYQFHPVDFISHRFCYVVVFFFVDISPETVIFFNAAYVYGLVQHSRINITLQPFAWLLATPQFHRLHHRLEPKYRNKNFATWLTFWDRILGTHAVADANVAPVFGVPAELNVPSDFWHQMTFPFKSRKAER